jgi:hypothetical protein
MYILWQVKNYVYICIYIHICIHIYIYIKKLCRKLSLIQQVNDKLAYILADGKLQKFQNRHDFVSQGYDYENIIKVPDWKFELLH